MQRRAPAQEPPCRRQSGADESLLHGPHGQPASLRQTADPDPRPPPNHSADYHLPGGRSDERNDSLKNR